ncbi:hypothetical protein [Caulobacter sp. 17J80-11]|uniref:hypothetical protein n=1 Tax=Caulobacter sp. 17J80-11 TaxID=2763502 RepID=UPI001653D54C|nr:hypothetical protein [Caulobacter sp. 17J80-11]MBC6980816.1 hypothetical protein [Caulobacter sp. 17J80-11]
MSDTVSTGHAPPASSDDRNLAFLVYALMFVAPFVFGFTGLVGVIVAYVRRAQAQAVTRTHYDFQIKVFWISVAIAAVGAIAFLFGLGAFINDVFQATTHHGEGWDAWNVAAVEGSDFQFHAASIIGMVVGLVITAIGSLWMMAASIFGVVRLANGQAIGRSGA